MEPTQSMDAPEVGAAASEEPRHPMRSILDRIFDSEN